VKRLRFKEFASLGKIEQGPTILIMKILTKSKGEGLVFHF
jgi:hypothetical protein